MQITGTTTITSLGTSVAGLVRECRFSGALTITASTAIVLPGAANIVTAANDVLVFRSLGSGNWTLVAWNRPQPAISDVTGLTAALAGKQASLGYTPVNKIGDTMTGTLAINVASGTINLDMNTGVGRVIASSFAGTAGTVNSI